MMKDAENNMCSRDENKHSAVSIVTLNERFVYQGIEGMAG